MKKIVVVIVAIVLMLAGGSFSVLKWMEVGPFAPEQEGEVAMVDSDEPPVFIDLEPLLINIFQDDSVITTVQISVMIEVLGKDNAALVNQSLPKITDMFLRDMHGFIPRVMKNTDKRIDLFVVKKRLKLMADRLYPDKRINDVLIQSISDGS